MNTAAEDRLQTIIARQLGYARADRRVALALAMAIALFVLPLV
jgi:hypothetical protein